MKRDFLTTDNWNNEDLEEILRLAAKYKKNPFDSCLDRKSLCLLFFNPSLRTRSSLELGIKQLGGQVSSFSVGSDIWSLEYKENIVMDGKNVEHIKDASKVLSRYFDAICVRSFPTLQDWAEEKKDPILNCFAKYSDVPVINMESNLFHPLQALADVMTIREKLGNQKKRKFVLTWAYHPKALPMAVPNSAALIASQFGMDVTIANPEDFDLSEEITQIVRKNCESNGSQFTVTNNMQEAFEGADIIYAKEWGSLKYYGNLEAEKNIREKLKEWIVDSKKMRLTNNAKFMHCLPVRRNVAVTDEVLDSSSSIIYDEAENRLHSQKGLLRFLLGK